MKILNRAHHLELASLMKAIRRGDFPEVYADLRASSGLNRDELVAIGAEIVFAMAIRSAERRRCRIGRFGVQVSKWAGLNNRPTDDPKRKTLVDEIFEIARFTSNKDVIHERHNGVIIGYLIRMAEYAIAADLPYSEEALVNSAHAAIKSSKRCADIEEVMMTLWEITRFGPITDWTLDAEITQLRPHAKYHLLRQLSRPGASS